MQQSTYHTEIELKIPFHDADMMEIVWHGHYAKYFEIARCELLDRIGYNYFAMRDSGYAWPIIDLRIRYIKPAVFGQKVTIRAAIAEWENRLKIDYLITDGLTGVKLVKGYTIQVAVNMRNQEMCLESPPVLFEKLGVQQP
ncbi:MAG: acyl-CoA thioesterase [Methylomicrobium sp.]